MMVVRLQSNGTYDTSFHGGTAILNFGAEATVRGIASMVGRSSDRQVLLHSFFGNSPQNVNAELQPK